MRFCRNLPFCPGPLPICPTPKQSATNTARKGKSSVQLALVQGHLGDGLGALRGRGVRRWGPLGCSSSCLQLRGLLFQSLFQRVHASVQRLFQALEQARTLAGIGSASTSLLWTWSLRRRAAGARGRGRSASSGSPGRAVRAPALPPGYRGARSAPPHACTKRHTAVMCCACPAQQLQAVDEEEWGPGCHAQ